MEEYEYDEFYRPYGTASEDGHCGRDPMQSRFATAARPIREAVYKTRMEQAESHVDVCHRLDYLQEIVVGLQDKIKINLP
jgi:hypothetical protein